MKASRKKTNKKSGTRAVSRLAAPIPISPVKKSGNKLVLVNETNKVGIVSSQYSDESLGFAAVIWVQMTTTRCPKSEQMIYDAIMLATDHFKSLGIKLDSFEVEHEETIGQNNDSWGVYTAKVSYSSVQNIGLDCVDDAKEIISGFFNDKNYSISNHMFACPKDIANAPYATYSRTVYPFYHEEVQHYSDFYGCFELKKAL